MRAPTSTFFIVTAGLMLAASLMTGSLMTASPALAQANVTPNFPGVQPPVPGPTYLPPPSVRGPGPYVPPKIDSFGDRATRSLHTFPLQGGQPGQPSDRDSYVRQNANQ
jgi:hypothetical protein